MDIEGQEIPELYEEIDRLTAQLSEARAEVARLRTTIGWIDEIVKKWNAPAGNSFKAMNDITNLISAHYIAEQALNKECIEGGG